MLNSTPQNQPDRSIWHKLGFHRYKYRYMTYEPGFDTKQLEFRYCSCGKWKRNKNPTDPLKYPKLNGLNLND